MIDIPKIAVTVVIPVRNEEEYIAPCLEGIVKGDFPIENLEVLVVDGLSEDRTREIIDNLSRTYPFIRLMDNPLRTVPHAMNIGIAAARGTTIVRIDAHAKYPGNYISQLLAWMAKLDADNVGGVCVTLPGSNTPEAHAVAAILSHPFGVGDSHFRLGLANAPREVDTVPFGCYKKTIFDRIGNYDEMLTRNQDDELNARLRRHGGRIFLIPEIRVEYYARDTLEKMAKMLYQYGYFKPLVAIKVGKPATLRQFAPPLFAAAVLGFPVLAFAWSPLLWLWVGILALHTTLNLHISRSLASKYGRGTFRHFVKGFFLAHLAYGIGYLKGLRDFAILRKHSKGEARPVTLSR